VTTLLSAGSEAFLSIQRSPSSRYRAGADRVAALLSRGTGLSPLLAGVTRAHLSMARGRWRDAATQLASVQPSEHRTVLEAQLLSIGYPDTLSRPRRAARCDRAAGARVTGRSQRAGTWVRRERSRGFGRGDADGALC